MQVFNTLPEVYRAALIWYGDWDIDSLCLAENRLARGEKARVEQVKTNLLVEMKVDVGHLLKGSLHLVDEVIPHGGHTDEECQYLLPCGSYVRPSQVEVGKLK